MPELTHTEVEQLQRFSEALEHFKEATLDLAREWEDAVEVVDVANYPEGLLSFDELAAQVAGMKVKV